MEFGGGEELGEVGEAVLVEMGVGHKGIIARATPPMIQWEESQHRKSLAMEQRCD